MTNMWDYVVEYSYYNYPSKQQRFRTYEQAKGFFHVIRKNRGVKKVELITPLYGPSLVQE